jgi:predicted protein tyrosine phosphatase
MEYNFYQYNYIDFNLKTDRKLKVHFNDPIEKDSVMDLKDQQSRDSTITNFNTPP